MLKFNGPQLALSRESARQALVSSAGTLASILDFLRRRHFVITPILFAALALAVFYLFTTPSSYTAQAVIIIDTRKIQLFQQPSAFGETMVDSQMVESQVQILKSKNVALSVVKERHLAEDPEFNAAYSGLIGSFLRYFPNSYSAWDPPSQSELTRRALRVFADHLTVSRVGLSYAIEISFRSLTPERAAQIANAIAAAYIADQLEAKYSAIRRTADWLKERIRELREQSVASERSVVEFKIAHHMVDAGGRLTNEQQIAEVNSQLVVARTQTSEARARLDRIETVLRGRPAVTPLDATAEDGSQNGVISKLATDATVTDSLKNTVITKLRSQYLDLANREAELSTRFGQAHLAAARIRDQMGEIRKSVLDELRQIAETYKSDYEIAKQRQDALQAEFAQLVSVSNATNHAQVTLRELESTAESSRVLYDNFLQRYMESIQQQTFPIAEARLISPADPPITRSHPKVTLVLMLSTVGGLFAGLGLAMIRDLRDRTFRTTGQIQNALGVDCIAVVPKLKGDRAARRARRRKPSAETPLGPIKDRTVGKCSASQSMDIGCGVRTIMREPTAIWAAVDSPISRFAEALRTMKRHADVSASKIIGFTSSLPQEGKSTIAAAFAVLTAQAGGRVILVDCDLRNATLSRALAPSAEIGIVDVVTNRARLDEATWVDPSTNVSFLPIVESDLAPSGEILNSTTMRKLFEEIRERYDYIVVDLPALGSMIDASTMTDLIDTYVLVIEWDRTSVDVAGHALACVPGIYRNLLGAVLNKADIRRLCQDDGNLASYFHSQRFAES
jgi:succinoglycan biosynthesis transport protein ExoP